MRKGFEERRMNSALLLPARATAEPCGWGDWMVRKVEFLIQKRLDAFGGSGESQTELLPAGSC